ncbi:MAG: 3-phosphoserine/phosphohydroxythreonine transaminase [Chitinophagales bacterium]|nr:3-phosphoserine/phosphohydroxythreonine transaminase [Bacteroidota bacterium]
MKKYNFYAGPAILPQEVLQGLAEAVLNFEGSGLSIAEISHRSNAFTRVIEEARELVREILYLSDSQEVLFLSGGSTTQFSLVPMNLLDSKKTAAYINTGEWASKAVEAAKMYGNAVEIASSARENFTYIPKQYSIPQDAAYLYFTSNNTIYGTQFHQFPETDVPLVADMCSDIFSREFDASRFALIHASAQKNLGPAGTTLLIVDKNILGKVQREIPEIFDYQQHIAKNSVMNTAPVLAIYGCYLTLKWIKARGLAKIEADNIAKAQTLYACIDKSDFYENNIQKADRSLMNVIFTLKNKDLERKFLAEAEQAGIIGIKGYRTVGGFRASLYNAMDLAGVEYLVGFMQEFEGRNG